MSSVSPYIFEKPDLVIKDYVVRMVDYKMYETDKEDFLNEQRIEDIRHANYQQLRKFLIEHTNIQFYKKLSKEELDTWILKNKLMKIMPNDISTDINLICTVMKHVFLKMNIEKDTYIKRYMEYRFKPIKYVTYRENPLELLVIKMYKNNHVFLATEINTVSSKKVKLTGYLLKTFKKSEMLEMLDYFNGKTYEKMEHTRDILKEQGKQQEIRVVDTEKVIVW